MVSRYYVKWLRDYFDFCYRYGFNQHDKSSLSSFIEKLHEKKQAEHIRKQAQHAVTLFLAMQPGKEGVFTKQINQQKPTTDSKEKNYI